MLQLEPFPGGTAEQVGHGRHRDREGRGYGERRETPAQ
jgi:hypothetical protein